VKIALIHISDIHYRSNENYLDEKIQKLSAAINSTLYGIEKTFITVSGDIAFSGKNEEFEHGFDLISGILESIGSQFKQAPEVIMIAGNHDCDFNTVKKSRALLIKNEDLLTDEELIGEVCLPLTNYFDFESLFIRKEGMETQDNLFKQHKFEIHGKTILFNCLNTAWVSQLHESPGGMLFPISRYQSYLENESDVSITLLHHPTHWLEPNNKRQVDAILRRNSDIILSGHEHTQTNTKITDYSEGQTLYFEGSALQTDTPDESSFSIIKIDLESDTLTKEEFIWSGNIYIKQETMTDVDIPKSAPSLGEFRIKEEYLNYINDLGIPLKHPTLTSNVKLDDLYVFPDVKIINFEEKKEIEDKINISLKEIINWQKHKKVLLIGNENFGKTSFCKMVYSHLFNNAYIPIKINGNAFDDAKIESIIKLVNRHFLNQYDKETSDEFEQLDKNKVVLIIDDFDNAPTNAKFRNNLMKNLDEVYPNILITGNEIIKFHKFLSHEDTTGFSNYTRLELLPFGHKLRGEMIEKWNRAGSHYTLDEDTLVRNIDKCGKVVSTIIGNSFVPSLPFFILMILQTRESEQSNISESAYGYYYEYLISQSFINIKLKNEDIDAFNNYLSHLAYHFFSLKIKEINRRDLLSFHEKYCRTYAIAIDFGEYERNLVGAGILTVAGNILSFKYKYVFYYFTAKYFSLNMDKPEVTDIVKVMCNKLYIEEYSNIVMFLSHLSKHPLILNSVYESARTILEEFEPSRLEEEIAHFNQMIAEMPELVFDESKDNLQHRKERDIAKDEIEKARQEVASDSQGTLREDGNFESFDIISKMNWSTKTIEIMGQIMRNYYGSTPGDQKLLLGEEAYLLSMRALNTFLTTFEQNKDHLISEVERIIFEKDVVGTDKADSLARNFVFNLMAAISNFFISKVTNALGSVNLSETFSMILEKNDTTAFRLIDLSIKFEHGKHIPFKEIEEFIDTLSTTSNILAMQILVNIAVNHLYMFPVHFSDRQRITEMLSLNKRTQHKITHAQKDKKK
jgi:predicted phosphodiesterase